MWSTWCSVLMTYRIGPWDSASSRMATALVGSCGVSTMTTPSSVNTMPGLQPRIVVSVQTLLVTFCIVRLLLSERVVVSADEDRADVGELRRAGLAQLSAVPGLLDASERQPRVGGGVGVDEQGARADPGADVERPSVVGGPHAGSQAVRRGVGELHRLVVVVERDDGGRGSEGLLRHHRHVQGDVHQDGRGEPGGSPAQPLATGQDPGACINGGLDLSFDVL